VGSEWRTTARAVWVALGLVTPTLVAKLREAVVVNFDCQSTLVEIGVSEQIVNALACLDRTRRNQHIIYPPKYIINVFEQCTLNHVLPSPQRLTL
jgi:hypothetical protein